MSQAQALAHSYRGVLGRWDPRSDRLATGEAIRPDLVVDQGAFADGRTVFNAIQPAISAALALRTARERVYIQVRPGTYRELLYVPQAAVAITIFGTEDDASATRIAATLDAAVSGRQFAETWRHQFASPDPAVTAMFATVRGRATIGTAGSAVAWIRNHGFQAKNITFENAYNKDRGDSVAALQSQAVAVLVDDADQVQFENVRFIGFQDTLYLRSTAPEQPSRVYFHKAYIEGDMDFIFGEATAYFHRSEIRSLGDRSVSYALAPSTHYRSKHGFVFHQCRFSHDGTPHALAGRFKLARQWFRGGAHEAVGKVAILESRIGAHIDKARPWGEWSSPGTGRHRPVQFDSDDLWVNLDAAGIDPARQIGYIAKKVPAEPFLAEYRNIDDE